MSYVYFLKPVGFEGPIKIGWSTRPVARLMEMANWSPIPIALIGAVPGTLGDESALHRAFAKDHSHKEWFHPTERILAAISAILSAGDLHPTVATLRPEGSIRHSTKRQPDFQERMAAMLSYSSAQTERVSRAAE